MNEPDDQRSVSWAASVFYNDCLIGCTLETAWKRMVDYKAWNPSYADSQVTLVRGEPCSEGELVLTRKSVARANGEPYRPFYAETVKVVPHRRIVWYIYPQEGDTFRNFVDFELAQAPSGVKFSISYYAQNRLCGEALTRERALLREVLPKYALALKSYCERGA